MRLTIDLPPEVLTRARRVAEQRQQSLPATLVDLVALGLATLDRPAAMTTDPVSGLPALTIGHPISAADVANALDSG